MRKLRDLIKMTTAAKTPSKHCFFQRGGGDAVASLSGSKDTALATLKSLLRQVARQLPPHDLDQRYCTSLKDDDEKTIMKEFVETALLRAVGQGRVRRRDSTDPVVPCHQCRAAVLPGQITVYALENDVETYVCGRPVWHADCFRCHHCRDQLVEQVYFRSSNDAEHIYCGRHFAETIRPRCAGCDEIIFTDECTEANGRFWHIDHFRCCECGLSLGGRRYVVVDSSSKVQTGRSNAEEQPYCYQCYHAVMADFCRTCGKVVEAGQRHVKVQSGGSDEDDVRHCWHADGNCFRCDRCHLPLAGLPLLFCRRRRDRGDSRSDQHYTSADETSNHFDGTGIYCSSECFDGRLYAGGTDSRRGSTSSVPDLISRR